MKRKLLTSSLLLAFVTMVSAFGSIAQEQITLKTSRKKGEQITLELGKGGKVTIEGAKKDKQSAYTVESENGIIVIKGEVLALNCLESDVVSLDLSQAPSLTSLDCSGNKLTRLDLSKNVNLGDVACINNQITELDLSNHDQMRALFCQYNQLTKLIAPKGSENFGVIICHGNQLKDNAINDLINSLPNRSGQEEEGIIIFIDLERDANVCTKNQVEAARELGWLIYTSDEFPYEGIDDESINDIIAHENADVVAIYNILGQRISQMQQGVNIVRLSNGKVRKVIMK